MADGNISDDHARKNKSIEKLHLPSHSTSLLSKSITLPIILASARKPRQSYVEGLMPTLLPIGLMSVVRFPHHCQGREG